ncbi:MAG TPA: MMPL family transporter [Solirubrobacteraceae bacterium]|jgi:RND superfamily putative drug exporter|nr:MMPL family transporter [Solirubrobacteraceae bacterium]
MRRLAAWCVRHRRITVLGWIAILVVCALAAGAAGATFKSNFDLPSSDSQRALDLLKTRFPGQSGDNATIVFHTTPAPVTQPAVRARMQAMFARVATLPHVRGVVSPYAPARAGGGAAMAPDGHTAFGTVQFDRRAINLPKSAVLSVIDTARGAGGDGIQVELGGTTIQNAQRTDRQGASEAIALLAAIVILLLTFGSVVAMGLPIITALVALGTGLSLVTLATHIFDTSNFTPALAAMIGLGVGIDYALFIATRFRAGLRDGLDVDDAVLNAMDTSGRAVLFAGATVVIALLGMFALGVSFLYGPAVASSLAVLLTMTASLTLMPAMLSKIGRRVDRWRVPGFGRQKPAGTGFWYRWSRLIQRRPWPAAIVSAALLIVLAIPVFSIQLGSADAGTDPSSTTTRRAYDLLAAGFGPGFNGPLQIVAELPRQGAVAGLPALRAAVAHQPGVVRVTPARVNPAGNTALLLAYPTTSPQSVKTKDLVDRLRTDTIPAIARTTGIRAHVGGTTAIFEDFAAYLNSKLPLFIGIVVALSALLLVAVFRSVLVPLKAVAMNLLSIGASFGVVVAIFQWGWLAGVIGVDRTAPIQAFLPVMVFAIVFGLSMDYEVFLMSRIHEEWVRRRNASEAVASGLANTGRVITAAATIMVCVFASFALGDDLTVKLFGIGLAVAVFLDAFVIRTALVPAIMYLLGEKAWWLPHWLDRVLPRVGVEPSPDALAEPAEPPRERVSA